MLNNADILEGAKGGGKSVFRADFSISANLELAQNLLEGYTDPAVIINEENSIILFNRAFFNYVSDDNDNVKGRRIGEALNCVNAKLSPKGCGFSDLCKYCGTLNSIVGCHKEKKQNTLESVIQTEQKVLNFLTRTTPLYIDGKLNLLVVLRDISNKKFRNMMESIFFHDIINLTCGIQGMLYVLPQMKGDETEYAYKNLKSMSKQLVSMIEYQRDFVAAERGELNVDFKQTSVVNLISKVLEPYRILAEQKGIEVRLTTIEGVPRIYTDKTILSRILQNLIKNAIEASKKGEVVSIRYMCIGNNAIFTVHNPAVIPEKVRYALFKRFVSTKNSRGHGLGTYSVKLLTENYLHGIVDYSTTAEEGTTFTVIIPRKPPEIQEGEKEKKASA